MAAIQWTALAVVAAFYVAYFTKMILQRRGGVKTDQIGKGNKPRKVLVVELFMKIATYSIVAVEVASVVFDFRMWRSSYAWFGIGIAAVGVAVFVVAMVTMRDSWRAGIPAEDKTELVTTGIYRISRNPAFLGFDLMYIGLLVCFFNYIHLAFVLFAVTMLHLQILQEEKFLTATFGAPYTEYKKRTGRYFVFDRDCSGKTKVVVALTVVLVVALATSTLMAYGTSQTGKLANLTFVDALQYTTANNPDAVITVGVVRDGQTSYKVYGNNGKELPQVAHTYEIGSLTKTFTAALINRAIEDDKIALDDTLDNYLTLSSDKQYPTIEQLLTHTSGYDGYYFEAPMIWNFLVGNNDFCGVSKQSVLGRVGGVGLAAKHDFEYSNFGYAVLGLVLEKVYDTDYTTLVNNFAHDELQLSDTKISHGDGDLGNYWRWNADDAYLSAGAITSNIDDMLVYAKLQLERNNVFAACHKTLADIDTAPQSYKAPGIGMDGIGMAWIVDNQNDIVWHNGGTSYYNSYLGFDTKTGVAVVVLSNLAPSYRIPATVLGVKLLNEMRG